MNPGVFFSNDRERTTQPGSCSMVRGAAAARRLALAALVWLAAMATSAEVLAKERHLEQLKVALMARASSCQTCHRPEDEGWRGGEGLNAYGRRLAELSSDDALADRMAELEREPAFNADGADAERKRRDNDIDGDGVRNWVEVLAGKNPADAADKPSERRRERIERVITCTLCHEQTNLPGKSGIDANPHNPFGRLLARTFVIGKGDRKPVAPEAVSAAAERTPILARLEAVRSKKPPRGRATYWQRIRLLRSTVDASDEPSEKQLAAFRKQAARQRTRRHRDPERGLYGDAHKPDGFLVDGEKLD